MDPVIHEGLDGDKLDEEATEREEFQLEFDHESPLHPGKYSENESDEEGIRLGDGRLYKNQKFADGDTFKKSVINEALRTGRNLEQYRYDKHKMGFKCVGSDSEGKDCAWKIYASFLPNDETWRVRLFIDKHSCLPGTQCKLLKVPVIYMMFRDKIREGPDYYTAMKIKEIVKERWNIDISIPQCQAARNKALRNIKRGDYYDVYKYQNRLLKSYKDSFVRFKYTITGEGQSPYFTFYVCFDVLRRPWKESCRPLIGVDDCSRISKMKGNVLVAVGRDANNSTYPLAWGALQVKSRDDWLWFVRNLKESLALNDGDGYIMVSNQPEELIEAVTSELPMIEHRKCVRHIYEELKSNYRVWLSCADIEDDTEDDNDSDNDDELMKQKAKEKLKKYEIILEKKPYIWKLACSYNVVDYEENYRSFANDGFQYLLWESNPKSWCRAFYKKGNYCEDVENNLTESFIKFISKAREKSFIPMLETIRRYVMTQNAERSKLAYDHGGICTPYVTKLLAAEHEKASQSIVIKSTNGDYKTMLRGRSYYVNLEKRTCTCEKFEICGIPCEHAYGVILVEKLIPEDFVCHWFRTSTWKRNYEENLFPVGGLQSYNINFGRVLDEQADKKRKKGVNQSPNKKQPKQKKCGLCKIAGHNIRFHKKQSKEGSQDQASQCIE